MGDRCYCLTKATAVISIALCFDKRLTPLDGIAMSPQIKTVQSIVSETEGSILLLIALAESEFVLDDAVQLWLTCNVY